MNILSCLCLEVKEIGAKSVAFRDAHAHRIYAAFLDMPDAKCPTFNTRHFGAAIAPLRLNGRKNS